MKKVLEWWRGRKWVYLGQSELQHYSIANDTKEKKNIEKAFVHFYAWQNNMKCRKYEFPYSRDWQQTLEKSEWYHYELIPWLAGGDIWKPIKRPIAVQGNLVNFYNGKSQP